tara:strand:- start:588 stop:986 length:399 start_codon:yes stop_codon:yes gene_type:complete
MGRKTQKRKAIHAELRKESKSFDGWLKYEVTIKNPDNTTEIVPAYGKDLQDALSRVVHDQKVERIIPTIKKVPIAIYVIFWFIIIGLSTTMLIEHQEEFGDFVGLVFIGAMLTITTFFIGISNYFKLKSVPK